MHYYVIALEATLFVDFSLEGSHSNQKKPLGFRGRREEESVDVDLLNSTDGNRITGAAPSVLVR